MNNDNTKLRGVITDDTVRAMRERNEHRQKENTEHLGDKYLLHPANQVQRKAK